MDGFESRGSRTSKAMPSGLTTRSWRRSRSSGSNRRSIHWETLAPSVADSSFQPAILRAPGRSIGSRESPCIWAQPLVLSPIGRMASVKRIRLAKRTFEKASGEFSLQIDVHDLAFDRTTPQTFSSDWRWPSIAFGKSSQVVSWESTAPAILSSVQMLTVPAIAKPSRELELINRASGWPFSNPNGVTLVQAVNALQRLGKDPGLGHPGTVRETDEGRGILRVPGQERDRLLDHSRCCSSRSGPMSAFRLRPLPSS